MKFVLACCLALSACGGGPREIADGPHAYVYFDERHNLEGGEPVRLHGFEIGVVSGVDLHEGRVRARVVLDPDVLAQLTTASTFSVEDDDGLYLEAHVIDPEAPALAEGASVDGVDSDWELAYVRTRRSAGKFADDVLDSDSWRKAADFIEEMKRDLGEIDWSREEQALREQLDETLRDLDELTDQSYEEVRERVEKLANELEKSGRSEEARKLRKRLDELWDEIVSDRPHQDR